MPPSPLKKQKLQHTSTTTTIELQHDDSSSGSIHKLPPPPVPSNDPALASTTSSSKDAPPPVDDEDDYDLFKLPALDAVKLLSANIELLVRMTGDVPPTPPLKTLTDPQMTGMQAEKENIARTVSEQNLWRLGQIAAAEKSKVDNDVRIRVAPAAATTPPLATECAHEDAPKDDNRRLTKLQAYNNAMKAKLQAQQHRQSDHTSPAEPENDDVDGVKLKRSGLTSPLSPPSNRPAVAEPYVVIGADSQPLNLQHGAITRKFYSKNEPPITITAYLLRLHQFCPMSTAVYLATSLYIHRLAIIERAIPVTKRNAHRLVLAGLRVAMKALEDLSYSHSKIAKVGGVSELELARLEVSFCFLTGFELVVGKEKLSAHWAALREGTGGKGGPGVVRMLNGMEVPTLRLIRRPRKVDHPPDG